MIVAFCQATVKGIYRFVYLDFETFANWFTWLRCVVEQDIFRPAVFINVDTCKICRFIHRFLSLHSFGWIEVPFMLIKCVLLSCFVLLKFRLEFCNTNDCNIRYMITESKTAWRVLQIRKLCFKWTPPL